MIGSWKLRESVAYGDGVGVSTDAARDASGARGHLSPRPTGGSGEPASFEIVGDRRNWWQRCTCCLRDRREIVTTAALDLRRQLVGSDGDVLWLQLLVLTAGTAGSDRRHVDDILLRAVKNGDST